MADSSMTLSPGAVSLIDSIIGFFERLGVCVAIFAGAAAIIHFKDKVLPFWPPGAAIVGTILLFGSIFLSIFVAGNWFTERAADIKSRAILLLFAAVVVVTTVFFVIAGGYAAIASLKA